MQIFGDMKNFVFCIERLVFIYVKIGCYEEVLGVWEELLKVDKVVIFDIQLRVFCGVIDV